MANQRNQFLCYRHILFQSLLIYDFMELPNWITCANVVSHYCLAVRHKWGKISIVLNSFLYQDFKIVNAL